MRYRVKLKKNGQPSNLTDIIQWVEAEAPDTTCAIHNAVSSNLGWSYAGESHVIRTNKPWRPSVNEGEEATLAEIVGQAIGAGSVCWTEINDERIFDSEQANWIVDGAIAAIDDLFSRLFPSLGLSKPFETAENFVGAITGKADWKKGRTNFVDNPTPEDATDGPGTFIVTFRDGDKPGMQSVRDNFASSTDATKTVMAAQRALRPSTWVSTTRVLGSTELFREGDADDTCAQSEDAYDPELPYMVEECEKSAGPYFDGEPHQRDDDKWRILRTVIEEESPNGSYMAGFLRRLKLIMDA